MNVDMYRILYFYFNEQDKKLGRRPGVIHLLDKVDGAIEDLEDARDGREDSKDAYLVSEVERGLENLRQVLDKASRQKEEVQLAATASKATETRRILEETRAAIRNPLETIGKIAEEDVEATDDSGRYVVRYKPLDNDGANHLVG